MFHKELPAAIFNFFTKVKRVKQKADGRVRIDVRVDGRQLVNCCKAISAVFPHWHVREHQPYHMRHHTVRSKKDVTVDHWCRFVSLNINGINKKRESLLLWATEDKADVICLQEHLRAALDWKVRLPGYQCFSSGAGDKVGSLGVAILVRNDIPAFERVASDYIVLVEVLIGAARVLVGSVYLPQKKKHQTQALELVAAAVNKELKAGSNVMLLGDFNLNRENITKKTDRVDMQVQLLDVEGDPGTWHRDPKKQVTAIDHVLTSPDLARLCSKARVLRQWDFSDHFPITVDVHIPRGGVTKLPAIARLRTEGILGREGAKKRVIQDNRYAALLVDSDGDPKEALDALAAGFVTVTKEIAAEEEKHDQRPKGLRHEFGISRKARNLIRWRSKVHAVFIQAAKASRADTEDVELADEAERAQKHYERVASEAATVIREEKGKQWQKYVNKGVQHLSNDDTRRAHTFINSVVTGKRRGLRHSPIRNEEGVLEMDHERILETWARCFARLAAMPRGVISDAAHWEKLIPNTNDGSWKEELPNINATITWKELQECMASMGRDKAPGESGIPTEWLRLAEEEKDQRSAEIPSSKMGQVILKAVQDMFEHGIIPENQREALMVPIPKKGDPTMTDNYRGICLMEPLSKLLCTLVNRRLASALEATKRLCKEQAGFRRREECMAHVTSLFEVCGRRTAEKLPTYLMFVDYAKAYDTVPHAGALRKLDRIGVRGKMLQFLKQLLSTSALKVRTNGGVSSAVSLERGLPQGNAVSSIIFDVFINDIGDSAVSDRIEIPDSKERIGELIYADDLVIFADSMEVLHRRAAALSKWTEDNQMAFGVRKCGVMAHNTGDDSWMNEEVRLGDKIVPMVKRYTYLGVVVNSEMCLEKVVESRVMAGLGALALVRNFLRLHTIPVSMRIRVVQSMLSPVINYAGELLGFSVALVRPLQRVMDRALRLALGLKETSKGCKAEVLYRQCGVPPVFASMSALRYRAYLKYPSLSTWAKVLGEEKTKERGTWHGGNPIYVKIHGKAVNPDASHKVKVAEFKAAMWTRTEGIKSVSESTTWQRYSVFSGAKGFVKKFFYDPAIIRGTSLLAAAQSGATWTALKAANAKLIPEMWKSKCPSCNKDYPETIEHVLLRCPAWREARRTMFDKIHTALRTNEVTVKWPKKYSPARATMLLGGAAEGCDLSPYWEKGFDSTTLCESRRGRARKAWTVPLFTYVASFLASNHAERSRRVGDLVRKTKSPTFNDGMTDLAPAPVTANAAS
jgi:exonuclease III